MSFVDHEGSVEYPFSLKTVFNAVIEAAPKIEGLELDSADELSGHITFKAGVSLASWGENIPIQLVKISSARTQMRVISTPKTGAMFGGAMDLGKNRRNIERIIKAVSDVLATKPAEYDSPAPTLQNISVADELLKLKQLLDEGLLTHDEFNEQKTRLLSAGKQIESVQTDPITPLTSLSESNEQIIDDRQEPIKIESSNVSSSNVGTIIFAAVIIIFCIIIFLLSMQ